MFPGVRPLIFPGSCPDGIATVEAGLHQEHAGSTGVARNIDPYFGEYILSEKIGK